MLRKKFLKLSVLLSLLTQSAAAHAVLFMAADADPSAFQKYSLQSNQQTYTQWAREKANRGDVEAHSSVLDFSKRAIKQGATKQILSDWEVLRLSIELNQADREVFILLAERLHLAKELCRYALLDPELLATLENFEGASACGQKATSLPEGLKKLSSKDLILIEGKAFSPDQLPAKLVPGPYQWTVISDRRQNRTFQGNAQEFLKNNQTPEPWVKGDSENYQLAHPDFARNLETKIFFTELKVLPTIPVEKTFGDWASEHKTLCWSLGILAAGVVAAQLRDKTLVFTKP